MRGWAVLVGLVVALCPALAAAQTPEERPVSQCSGAVLCRYAETHLADAYGVPLTIQAISICRQFCSADYWIRDSRSGADLLQFGHGGPMGPPLLALGPFAGGGQGPRDASQLQVRRFVWVPAPTPRAIDDGRYEETTFLWDASRDSLVPGATRAIAPGQLAQAVGALESDGLQLLLPLRRW